MMRITEDPEEAAFFLKKGKIVIFPTETVFGIGANALDAGACRRIYTLKGRPSDNPLILHIGRKEDFSKFGEIDEAFLQQFSPFIPGPLTLILRKKEASLFSAGLPTIGLRMPAHEKTLEMLGRVPFPVAAPSANLSGKPSLTRIEDVIAAFSDKADLLLKGDNPHIGLESTVIDLSRENPLYLRPGVVSFEELQLLLPKISRWVSSPNESPPSPGLKYRHYAPEGRVIIYQGLQEILSEKGFASIGFEPLKGGELSLAICSNTEYARELYAFFTLCDKRGIKTIYCQTPKEGALQEALLERLLKASSS